MSNLRVFELAKEIGMTPLALMDKIKEWNLPIKNHMAKIEPEMVEQIMVMLNVTGCSVEERNAFAIKNPLPKTTLTKSEETSMSNENEVENSLIGIIEKIKMEYEKFNKTKVKIAILGKSGTGKSSFINALAGQRIAKTNPIKEETGMADGAKVKDFTPVCYSVEGIEFYDLPGFGTNNFPAENFLKEFDVKKTYDCILYMSSLRFNTESDLTVYSQIKKSNIPCFVIWTKFDETVRRAHRDFPDSPKDEVGLAAEIVNQIKIDLKDEEVNAFVISDEPLLYDFTRLKQSIEEALPEIKKERFIQSAAAQTEKDLVKKRLVADKLVAWMSAIAGVASAVPDPTFVAGVAFDVGLLQQMTQKILKLYGLDESSIEYQSKLFSKKTILEVSKRLLKFASKEALVQVLKRAGSKLAAKKITAYIPFVGQIVAGVIGFKIASSYGKEIVDESEALAREVLDSEISRVA